MFRHSFQTRCTLSYKRSRSILKQGSMKIDYHKKVLCMVLFIIYLAIKGNIIVMTFYLALFYNYNFIY